MDPSKTSIEKSMDDHVAPRIGFSFQVTDLPQPKPPVPPSSSSSAVHLDGSQVRLVHTINQHELQQQHEYLGFCKRITLENDSQFYSEDDELLLQYLHQQAHGNIPLAQFGLINKLTAGESLSHRRFDKFLHRKSLQRLNMHSGNQNQSEASGAMITAGIGDGNNNSAHDNLPVRKKRRNNSKNEKVGWGVLYDRSDVNAYLMGDLRADAGSLTCNRYGYTDLIAFTKAITATQADQQLSDILQIDSTSSRGHADRSEIKTKWRNLKDRAHVLLHQAQTYNYYNSSSIRPTLRDLLQLLHTSRSLPLPSENYGESFVSHSVAMLNRVLKLVAVARDCLAELQDVVYIGNGSNLIGNGAIELQDVKRVIRRTNKLPVELEEVRIVKQIVAQAEEWEGRVQKLLGDSNQILVEMVSSTSSCVNTIDYIALAEELLEDGTRECALSLYQLRLKSRLQLERKVQRSRAILDKWVGKLDLKVLSAMVRDLNRIGLYSPEVHRLCHTHTTAEQWVARVNLANRSTTALADIKKLLLQGEEIPLHLIDYLNPLRDKLDQAKQWKNRFYSCLQIDANIQCELDLLRVIRDDLQNNAKRSDLLDLHSEGKRLSTQIPQWLLLDLEKQSDQWSERAKDILLSTPSIMHVETSTKYSLEDVRQHMFNGSILRSNVFSSLRSSSSFKKRRWRLENEEELSEIVNNADAWLEKYRQYTQQIKRKRISLKSFKQFYNDATAYITSELRRETHAMVQQCMEWMSENDWMLNDSFIESQKLTIEEVQRAVSVSLPVDLEEFFKLKTISLRIQDWLKRAEVITKNFNLPERVRVSSEEKVDSVELTNLLKEAPGLPICVSEEVVLIQQHIEHVEQWKRIALDQWKEISAAFRQEQRCRAQLNQDESYDEGQAISEASGHEHGHNTRKPPLSLSSSNACIGFANVDIVMSPDTFCDDNCGMDDSADSDSSTLDKIPKLIGNLLGYATSIRVHTIEEEACEALLAVWDWYEKAKSLIEDPKNAIADPTSKDLEILIQAGIELCTQENDDDLEGASVSQALYDLNRSWRGLLLAEGYRLDRKWRLRNEFLIWREKTHAFVNCVDKFSLTVLHSLQNQCSSFPEGIELVQAFTIELKHANDWFEEARDILDNGKKQSLEKMKNLITQGEKLKVAPNDELKALKQQVKLSKAWTLRVKKILPIDDSEAANLEVRKLINEHDISLIEMPEVISTLRKATSCYCICRESFSTGLMVACDECDEWYHGPCIGVSAAQAERCDKYLCVRCSLLKNMKNLADIAIGKVRKWTDWGELIKARQIDGQKHQRKVRRERREIEKKTLEIEETQLELKKLEEISNDGSSLSFTPENLSLTPSLQISSVPQPIEMNQSSSDISTRETDPTESTMCVSIADGISAKTSTGLIAPNRPGKLDIKSRQEVLREKIRKANKIIASSSERLSKLERFTHERKDREEKENSMSSTLRDWLLKVFRHIFASESTDMIDSSRPLSDGTLSKVMADLLDEASLFDILRFPDIQAVRNSFYSMAWVYQAQIILAKKPLMSEIERILDQSESISLPDERATKIIRHIHMRSKAWKDRVQSALAPSTETRKPYDITILEKLYKELRNLPLIMIEESRLWNTIDDNGARHCLCGGPGDGSFMLACDKCEQWFHGICVGLDKNSGESLMNWLCPKCSPCYRYLKPVSQEPITEPIRTRSPHAPQLDSLWPPLKKENLPEIKITTKGCFLQERKASMQAIKSEDVHLATKRCPPSSPSLAPIPKQRKRLALTSSNRPEPSTEGNFSSDQVPKSKVGQATISKDSTKPGPVPMSQTSVSTSFPVSSSYSNNPHMNLAPFLNAGMMAPEATMMLSGTIAALSAQALLANSALFPTNTALSSITPTFLSSHNYHNTTTSSSSGLIEESANKVDGQKKMKNQGDDN